MNTFARSAKTVTLLVALAFTMIPLATGCAVDTTDGEDSIADEQVGSADDALKAGLNTTLPRQYLGPVSACAAPLEKIGALCYPPCAGDWVAWESLIGAEYCCPPSYTTPLVNLSICKQRAPSSLTCPQGQEYINGSCYAACPSGCVSLGINGCSCTGGG
jgi:hypothetical protein